jgi:NitT/TauT family transport system substrate-binding protein
MKMLKALWATVAAISTLVCLQASCLAQDVAADAELVETRTEVPKLKDAATYSPKDGVVEIELSKYAGYSGLVVANGGLDASADSVFAKKYGFKVKLTLSEEESWSALNSGKMAASATTADVMAVYGRQFQVVVPVLIGFSRGADGVVVTSDIKKINDLQGKVLAASQFTESDFFIRYLADEAGLKIKMLANLTEKADPKKLNLVYCADGFGAGDIFLRDLKAGRNRMAGCVTWEPKTSEVVKGSEGKSHLLISNRNLLIIADILIVNKGFAQAHPEMVKGLVAGMIEGNDMVRNNQSKQLAVIGKAFGWTDDVARAELAKVHLANLPENDAFFSGAMDSAGSFGYIYETAPYVYGSELIGKPVDADKLVSLAALKAIKESGDFKDQKASITPLRADGRPAEKAANTDAVALLSKDIRFLFSPNSSKLEAGSKENTKGLESISQLLKVSPGSKVLLRGHADGSMLEKFRADGGEAKVREMKLSLKSLSKARCAEVKQILQEKLGVDESRIETQGVGADEPTGNGPDADRRVEVQWFTVE